MLCSAQSQTTQSLVPLFTLPLPLQRLMWLKLPSPLASLVECLQFPLPLPISPLNIGVPRPTLLSSSWAISFPHTASPYSINDSRKRPYAVPAHSAYLKPNYLLFPIHLPSCIPCHLLQCALEYSHVEPVYQWFLNFLFPVFILFPLPGMLYSSLWLLIFHKT